MRLTLCVLTATASAAWLRLRHAEEWRMLAELSREHNRA